MLTSEKINLGTRHLIRELLSLLLNPAFVILTLLGNGMIVLFSYLFYFYERDANPNVSNLLDALYWGVETVTTVGYGDIVPVTNAGKLIAIVTMILGVGLFFSFIALFTTLFVNFEVTELGEDIEDEVAKLKRDLTKGRKNYDTNGKRKK